LNILNIGPVSKTPKTCNSIISIIRAIGPETMSKKMAGENMYFYNNN
jgi:hypothetical protein